MCLVATWYEHDSTFQRLYVWAAFFLLFIMRVIYINNETCDFLGAQQNHVCCKKLKQLRKQLIAPLSKALFLDWLNAQAVKFTCSIVMLTCSMVIDHKFTGG